MNKQIDDSLDMVPLDDIYDPAPVEKVEPPTDIENDFTYARENFYNVIEKGSSALEDMLNVARASEHPRAYEVVSTIMKTLMDANKDLVELAEKKKKQETPEEKQKVTNNNLFVGSTADLQQLLKDMKTND
jgi:hypothetical protein